MNTLDAVRRMVASYPGGRAALALRLGKTDDVLRKEISGAQTHKLGLVDAVEIATMCQEVGSPDRHLLASALALGSGKLLDLPVIEQGGCLMSSTARSVEEVSHLLGAVATSLSDGSISQNDLARIEKEAGEAFAAVQQTIGAARERFRADTAHMREAQS